jgi:hypothetical protein
VTGLKPGDKIVLSRKQVEALADAFISEIAAKFA